MKRTPSTHVCCKRQLDHIGDTDLGYKTDSCIRGLVGGGGDITVDLEKEEGNVSMSVLLWCFVFFGNSVLLGQTDGF